MQNSFFFNVLYLNCSEQLGGTQIFLSNKYIYAKWFFLCYI